MKIHSLISNSHVLLSDRAKRFVRFLDNGILRLLVELTCSVLEMVPFQAIAEATREESLSVSSKAQQSTFFMWAFALELQATVNNNQCLMRLPKFKCYLLVQVVMQSCQLFSGTSQRMHATEKVRKATGSGAQLIWKWLNNRNHTVDSHRRRMASPLFSKFRGGANKIRCPFGIECADQALPLAPYQEHQICALRMEEALLWLDGMPLGTPMAYTSLGINWRMCVKNLFHNYEISLPMRKHLAGSLRRNTTPEKSIGCVPD